MSQAVGIDVGSVATKAVLIDKSDVLAKVLIPSGASFTQAAEEIRSELAGAAGLTGGLASIPTVSTGYGRKNVAVADRTRTEIACHALGVHHHIPGPLTVVDIGGQDNKVIRVGPLGQVLDFTMNRKCAAGTGAFLEETARRLGVPLSDLDELAREADEETPLGSFCTVFASTEMLKLIREGRSVPSIVRGALRSVVRRVVEMSLFEGDIVLSGGVAAHNPSLALLLAEETKQKVRICPDAQYAGALGAALFAQGGGKEGGT